MPRATVARRGTTLIVAFVALVAAAIGLDRLLHAFGLRAAGGLLGPVGTGLIAISFAYSLRKRGVLRSGSPRALLRLHEGLAWSGSLAILVHAGVHMHALLPWLAVAAMLAAVLSGMVGEYLLGEARERLAARERSLAASGAGAEEAERRLLADALAVRALETWRVVHLPVAINFAVLALLHILTVLVLG